MRLSVPDSHSYSSMNIPKRTKKEVIISSSPDTQSVGTITDGATCFQRVNSLQGHLTSKEVMFTLPPAQARPWPCLKSITSSRTILSTLPRVAHRQRRCPTPAKLSLRRTLQGLLPHSQTQKLAGQFKRAVPQKRTSGQHSLRHQRPRCVRGHIKNTELPQRPHTT